MTLKTVPITSINLVNGPGPDEAVEVAMGRNVAHQRAETEGHSESFIPICSLDYMITAPRLSP